MSRVVGYVCAGEATSGRFYYLRTLSLNMTRDRGAAWVFDTAEEARNAAKECGVTNTVYRRVRRLRHKVKPGTVGYVLRSGFYPDSYMGHWLFGSRKDAQIFPTREAAEMLRTNPEQKILAVVRKPKAPKAGAWVLRKRNPNVFTDLAEARRVAREMEGRGCGEMMVCRAGRHVKP